MRNKLLAAFLLGFYLVVSIPTAKAADLPVLTWERGKEHNIVLGGSNVQSWQMVLHSTNKADLVFNKSKPNKRGFIVFSLNVPADYELGTYTVQTKQTTTEPSVVAGIRLIELTSYNLIQIPIKLFVILFVMIFLISTLSILRMPKYEQIQYLKEKRKVVLPNILGRVYGLRNSSVESIRKSLFKFLITREGELLHKISPLAWALVPILSVVLGCYVGASTRVSGGVSHVSVVLFVFTAILGIFDPYSGFMATAGFIFAQGVLANVLSIRSLMGLVAVGTAWIGPGIISSLYRQMLEKDGYISRFTKFLPDLFSSVIGAFIFILAELLANSFTNHIGSFGVDRLYIPVFMGVVIFIRIKFEKYLFRNIHIGGDSYQVRTLTLPRVISPRTVLFIALYLAGISYVWTQSVPFTLSSALILSIPLVLLLVRFGSPRFERLKSIQRNIVGEGVVLCLLAYGVFTYIQSMPLDVIQKGRYFIIYSALLLIAHAIYSSICDTSTRDKVVEL
jgi:hypothetical protein